VKSWCDIVLKPVFAVVSAFVLVCACATPLGLKSAQMQAPPLPDSFGVSASLIEVTLNLGLVLVAIVVLAWLFKRFQGMDQPAAGQLKVTASLPLGPKERIIVIEVGDEQILVGASSAGISTLHVLNAPLRVVSEEQESFRDKLVRSLKGAQT